jgi:hypothetical protein
LRSARMCSRNDDSSGDTWQAGSYAQIFVLVGSLRLQVQKRSKRREADSTMETAPNARLVSSWARLALLNFPDPGVARSWFCPEASERRSSDSPSPRRRSAHAPRDSSPGAFAPPVISTGHAPNKPIALNELPEPDIPRSICRANTLDRPRYPFGYGCATSWPRHRLPVVARGGRDRISLAKRVHFVRSIFCALARFEADRGAISA